MKRSHVRLLCFLSLSIGCIGSNLTFSQSPDLAKGCYPTEYPIRTLFLPRSQGSDTARRLVGWQYVIPGCDDRFDGDINIVAQYAQSFDDYRISDYLFGSNCLELIGSDHANLFNNIPKLKNTWFRADDVGMPTNFLGRICFKPKIENTVVDILFHFLLDPWCEGMFAKAFIPITHTRWNLNIEKQTSNIPFSQGVGFPPCYMSTGEANATASICQALGGAFTFGDMKQPLDFGQLPLCKKSLTAVADIDVLCGVNLIQCATANVGPFLMLTIPAGNKPKGEYIFEPIVGNGGHWEFGGGCEGHWDLKRWDYAIISVSWFGHVTYQFKTWQVRYYDLVNKGPFSRYLLLKELDKDNEYTGRLDNAINFDATATRAGGSIRTDASVKLSIYNACWGFDIGYNFWALTREKLCIDPYLYPSDLRATHNLLIKGTNGVCETVVDEDLIVKYKDIDLNSGRVPKQITNSIFTHISYTALNKCWEPQIGVGAQAEWALTKSGYNCPPAGLNQWRFWVKFGVSF